MENPVKRMTELISFSAPAEYQITVKGNIPTLWEGRLSGMTITKQENEQNVEISMLKGILKDQSALSGVLKILFSLHLPIVSINLISNNN